MEQEGGIGGAEAVLSVLDLVAPAIAGAVDPTTTAVENLLTPAFSRRTMAEALTNFARESAPSMLTTGEAKPSSGDTGSFLDWALSGSRGDLRPELRGAASFAELLAPAGIPGVKVLGLTKAGRAAQLAGQTATKTIPAQVKAGERALLSVNPTLGLEKLISTANLDIPVPIPKQAEIVQKGADAAAAVGRGVLKAPGLGRLARTMLPPGPEAAVSANRAVREAEPVFRDTLESAAREHVAKLGELEDRAAQLLERYPQANRPEVALALTEAPLAAAERKAAKLANPALQQAALNKGRADLAALQANLSPEDVAAIGETRALLGSYEPELVRRGILDPTKVDPTITGKRYLPVVPRAAGEEAKQVRAVIDAEYAKTGVHPDQIAQNYGYKDYMQVFDLEKNAPKQVLSTAIGKPTTPNVKKRAVPIDAAVQDPKTYFEGVVAPAFIGAARSEQAIRSYDTLEKLYDTAQQLGLAKVIDPTDPLQVAKLGDYARLPGGDVFEPAFTKTRGLPAGHQIYVPKDLANMVDQYLNPKGVGEILLGIQQAQQALVPFYTTLRPKFTTSNNLSGQLFNAMHLGSRGMARTLRHMPTTFETARVLSGEGRAALRNPANQKLLSTVIETDAGPVRVSQLMDEMLTQGVVGQGVRGSEYVEKVGGKVGVNTNTPWNERIPVGKQLARGADIIETHNRVQGYIGQRLMGASPKEAARQTLKWQVDYSKPLSQEAKLARVFSPFFRWYQAQVPNMIKAIMAQPTTVRGMLKAPQMVEATVNTPEDNRQFRKTQPAYSRERSDVNVTGVFKPLNTRSVVSLNPRQPGPSELSTLDIVTKPLTAQHPVEAVGDAVMREFGHRFGPVPTVAAGLLMNRDTFRQREIRDYEPAPPALVDLAQRGVPGYKDIVRIDPRSRRYVVDGKTLFALRQIPGAEELLAKAPASALAAYEGESPARTGVSGFPSKPADDTVAASVAYMLSLLGLNLSSQSAAERSDAARRAEAGRLYRESRRPVPIRR